MTARHILTYARTLEGGGVERAQLRLIRGWIAMGRRVTLVLGDAAGPLTGELPPGIDLTVLGDGRYRALIGALPGIVRRSMPDVIFCPGNYYTSVAAVTKLRLGSACPPIIAKMSNAPDRGDHNAIVDVGHRIWLALHGRFLDRLVAMTPATAAAAARMLRMTGRTSVIANPPVAPAVSAAAAALPPGRVILGVGRLVPQKRWDRLIAALPALPADVSLVILGEGSLRPALEQQARDLGIADRVHLPGHSDGPLTAMAAASLVALTSDYEGVPGVLREALSVGTPVVATDSSEAVAEIVSDPTLGTIVGRDDAAGLAAALNHWLDAPRPAPVPQPGAGSAQAYLDLFDTLA